MEAQGPKPKIGVDVKVPKHKVAAPVEPRPIAEKRGRGLGLFALVAVALVAPQAAIAWKPVAGAYAEVAAFAVLVATGLIYARARKLVVSAAILPMAAIVIFCLPKVNVFVGVTVYYCTILLFGLVYAYMFATDGSEVHLSSARHQYWAWIPLMIVLGEVLGAVGFLMLRQNYSYGGVPILTVALFSIVFAAAEATVFQGLIQQSASEVMHPVLAALLAAVAYAGASVSSDSVITLGFGLVAGAVVASVYLIRQNVVLVTCLNAVMKLSYLALLATFVLR